MRNTQMPSNFSRRSVLSTGLILTTTFAGCTSLEMLHSPRTYDETVSSILISSDATTLAVISEKYHYVFNEIGGIGGIMKSVIRPILNAKFSRFIVHPDNTISGVVVLSVVNPLPEEIKEAELLGFKLHAVAYEEWGISIHISGTRHLAVSNNVLNDSYRLKQQYKVKIIEEFSNGEKVVRWAVTPIAITAEGVAMVVLAPVGMVMIAFAMLANPRAKQIQTTPSTSLVDK